MVIHTLHFHTLTPSLVVHTLQRVLTSSSSLPPYHSQPPWRTNVEACLKKAFQAFCVISKVQKITKFSTKDWNRKKIKLQSRRSWWSWAVSLGQVARRSSRAQGSKTSPRPAAAFPHTRKCCSLIVIPTWGKIQIRKKKNHFRPTPNHPQWKCCKNRSRTCQWLKTLTFAATIKDRFPASLPAASGLVKLTRTRQR